MAAIVKPRSYNSPTRRQQLAATKLAVLVAANGLMARRGYSATTMEQIAADAGVAVQTVYKHFGSKARIVTAIAEHARRDPRIAQHRKQLLNAKDAREQVRLLAQRARLYAELGFSIVDVLPERTQNSDLAKALDPLIADVRRSHLEYARSLADKRALRTGVSVEQAADYIALVSSPEMLRRMQRDLGWSFDHCERWMADALMRLLLN